MIFLNKNKMKCQFYIILLFSLITFSFSESIQLDSLSVPSDSLKNNIISHDSILPQDKMVITGTRTKRLLEDNPSNVSLITNERINSAPLTNISDVLLSEPSVIVRRSVGMAEGIPSDISMRGVPGAVAATRTLVLVDGIPTNAAGTPFLILNEIPIESIDRVEIVRGPYSNLYGPNAFGGVVNIITKKPQNGIHAGFSLGGYNNFYDFDSKGEVTYKKFSMLINGSIRGIGNYYGVDSVPHEYGKYVRMTSAENYDYYDKRLFGKLSYTFTSRTLLTIHTRYFESDLGFGKTEYGNPPSDIIVKGRKYLIGPYITTNISQNIDLKVGGFYRHIDGLNYNQSIRTDTLLDPITGKDTTIESYTNGVWKSYSNDYQIELQTNIKTSGINTLTAGFDILNNSIFFGPRRDAYKNDLCKGADSAQKDMLNTGIYIQDEIKLFKKLISIAGIRFDYNSIFGSVFSPRIGFVYKHNKSLRLKLSFGRAFRAPSLAELYMPDLPLNTSTTLQANPDLKPEYIWSLDFGPEYNIFNWLKIKSSIFYNFMDNLITQKVTNAGYQEILMGKATLSHKNVEKAWSYGLENSLEIKVLDFANIFMNYTYTNSYDIRMKGKLEYIPDHQANTGLLINKTIKNFTVTASITENFMGERDYLDWAVTMQDTTKPLPSSPTDITPSYVTLPHYFRTDASLKISYKDFLWLSLDCLNLTNQKIAETATTYAPKRFFYVKIGAGF